MLLEGIIGVQKEAVLAAKRSIVTVEEIVDEFGPRSLNAVILPHWTVGAIAMVPGGAYPVLCAGLLQARQRLLHGVGRDRARPRRFLAWMKANVLEQGPDVFAAHARKLLRRRRSERMADATRPTR